MTMPIAGQIAGTIPMFVVAAGTIKVVNAVFKRNGKPVGRTHFHFRGKRAMSHRHTGGGAPHTHKGLRGYGRTRKALRR